MHALRPILHTILLLAVLILMTAAGDALCRLVDLAGAPRTTHTTEATPCR